MAVIKCPECGHQTSEKATICPSCGVEIAGKVVRCTNCGEVFFKEDGLCPHCYRPYQTDDQKQELVVEEEKVDIPSTETEPIDEKKPSTNEEEYTPTEDTIIKEKTSKTQLTYTSPVITVVLGNNSKKADVENEDNAKEEDEERMAHTHTIIKEDEEDDDEDRFIDTDAEQLERPTKEIDDEFKKMKSSKRYIPVVVSIVITALIAAVCLYFYNDSKSMRELQAFNSAMENGDVDQLTTFLRDFSDASAEHKQKAKDEIARLNKQEQDLSLVKVTRDKTQLLQYLKNYPDTPMKKDILATIDSIDWEDATKTNTKAAYDKYIAEHTHGIFIKDAKDRVAVKEVAATEEDTNLARSLFREFFLSVNGNDPTRLTNTLNGEISKFMGTEKPGSSEVVNWMKRQHGENVSNVIWKLNNDYIINKREQNGAKNYNINFTAKQTIIHKDGHSSSENYKITSEVTEKGKIASMTMVKYTPKPGEAISGNSSTTSKPATSSSTSSSPSKPASSSASSKPATSTPSKPASSSTSNKPATSTPSKPASSSTSSKPATTPSKPASNSSSSKPATTPSKPASSSTSSKSATTPSKPASSSQSSKPATTPSKPASSSSSSKPATTPSKPASSSSSSKPATSTPSKPASSSTNKPTPTSKPSSNQNTKK